MMANSEESYGRKEFFVERLAVFYGSQGDAGGDRLTVPVTADMFRK